jgi:hypothetical protein
MRPGWKSASTIRGATAGWLVLSAGMGFNMASAVEPLCDQYNPFGPARSGEITLDASDFADEDGTELLSFIETDSIGKVDVEIVSTSPAEIVRAVSAVPEISTMSPNYGSPNYGSPNDGLSNDGERLKGIKVTVSVQQTKRPVRIVLKLRQVCARHFRNTFLYY